MAWEVKSIGVAATAVTRELLNVLRAMSFRSGTFEEHEVAVAMPVQAGKSTVPIKLLRYNVTNQPPTPSTSGQEQPPTRCPFFLPSLSPPLPLLLLFATLRCHITVCAAHCRWVMRQEAKVYAHKLRTDLVSVYNVTETPCFGQAAPDFWLAMGGRQKHEMLRRGNQYHCMQDGTEIKVKRCAARFASCALRIARCRPTTLGCVPPAAQSPAFWQPIFAPSAINHPTVPPAPAAAAAPRRQVQVYQIGRSPAAPNPLHNDCVVEASARASELDYMEVAAALAAFGRCLLPLVEMRACTVPKIDEPKPAAEPKPGAGGAAAVGAPAAAATAAAAAAAMASFAPTR